MYTQEELELIQQAYDNLEKVMKKQRIRKAHFPKIKKAFELARDSHEGMYRKSGEPFILHPIEVAKICADELKLGSTSIMCGLLHDTVEDTDLTLKDIEKLFGKDVSDIVYGLTKVKKAHQEYSSSQAETFKKIILSIFSNLRIVLVKLADRLHNMRTLGSMSDYKIERITSETMFIYVPIAHRLGLNGIRSELEDLCFMYQNPKIYEDITQKLKKNHTAKKQFINSFFMPIKKELDERGIRYKHKVRVKSVSSIWKKMLAKNIPFEEVYDLSAIRIIIDCDLKMEKTKCWEVYSIITDFYRPNQNRLRDWISIPKSNGYESLQTTVMSKTGKWVEVQIRSKRMDQIAETGLAAHWRYKNNENEDDVFKRWVNEMKGIISLDNDTLELIDHAKLNLFKDDITVYLNNGKVVQLPKDSCVLDLAFNINKYKGLYCQGAKINGKIKPILHKIVNNDHLDVIFANEKSNISKESLKHLKTSTAKIEVKKYLFAERNKKIKLGEDRFFNTLKKQGIKSEKRNIDISEVVTFFNEVSIHHFFEKVFERKINLKSLKKFSLKNNKLQRDKALLSIISNFKTGNQKQVKQTLSIDDFNLVDSSSSIIDKYILSMCCCPKVDDNIIGYISADGNLEVHKNDCKQLKYLINHYSYRVKRISWFSKQNIKELNQLIIEGVNKHGIAYEIVKIISYEHNGRLYSINIKEDGSVFECKIKLFTKTDKKLKYIINSLNQLKEIKRVYQAPKAS